MFKEVEEFGGIELREQGCKGSIEVRLFQLGNLTGEAPVEKSPDPIAMRAPVEPRQVGQKAQVCTLYDGIVRSVSATQQLGGFGSRTLSYAKCYPIWCVGLQCGKRIQQRGALAETKADAPNGVAPDQGQ